MNIFDYMKKLSAEETVEVTPEVGSVVDTEVNTGTVVVEEPGIVIDAVSVEEETVEVITDDEHSEIVDDMADVQDMVEENASLEHFATSATLISEVMGNLSGEAITHAIADSVNAHIDCIQSFVTLNGGPELNSRKFTPEDFLGDSTPETRAVIAQQSAEDFKEKAKAAVAKTVEVFLNIFKRIKEVIARLFVNADKIKARAMAAHKKSMGVFAAPSGEHSAPNSLCVGGALNIKEAVASFNKNSAAIISHCDMSDKEVGLENIKKLADNFDTHEFSLSLGLVSAPIGKSAKDAKILFNLGGNVDVGLGNGCLYTADVDGKKDNGKIKPLSKADIQAITTKVIADYDTITTIKNAIDKVETQLVNAIESVKKIVAKKESAGEVTGYESKFSTLLVKAVTKKYSKSGINVLNHVATLCYMTSMDAIKVCEWSMSGKASNKELTAK